MAANPQWRKEWIPLFSQQLRLRNLTQVLAYNVRGHGPGISRQLFYYTLHLTSKSAPFYSSEPCTGPNPRWVEINLPPQVTTLSGTGLVVRIWQCGSPDELVTIWGLHLSGLVPVDLQEDLSSDLGPNALVFFLHGLPFVAPSSSQPVKRLAKSEVSANSARSSYTVNQLLRLHHIQLATANKAAVSDSLKQSIQRQGPFPPAAAASGLLGTPSQRYKIQQLKAQREDALHRLWLLRGERARYEETITGLKAMAERLKEETSQRSTDVAKQFENLSKEEKRLREFKMEMSHTRELLLQTSNQLAHRRKQLISQLILIYPIVEDAQGNVKICDVPLTSSDCVDTQDEASSAVALGFAAHATVMVATFLDVPLRYPIIPAGSRARIWDLVAPRLTDSEREFPLFSRGRDKMQFNYAVYVFNKDIAQLRWYCGLLTRDLKPTLLNLRDLFNIKVVPVSSKHKRSLSASSQEYLASSHLSVLSRHDAETSIEVKTTKDTDLLVSPSVSPNPPKVLGSLESWDFQEPPINDKPAEKEQALSCSLDQGLDTLQRPKFKQTLSLLSPGKSTNNSEPSLSSRVEDLRIEDSKEAIEDAKVERQSSESIPTSNGSVHDNSYPVKARTYSEPCSSDQVIEEFHDCLFMPNIDSASSPKRKDDENECEKSNSAVEESSESEAVLTKLNSIDNLFASVASRTEALANRSGSFNLVKSRASTMESS